MAMRELDLGWLRLFDELGRHQNLTQVAKALGLTQPAVSYQLRRLEGELGTPLVRRLHRGAELTREGQILYEAIRDSVSRIDGAVRQIRRRERSPAIRIYTDFGYATYKLMPRLDNFRKLEPDVEVHVLASQNLQSAEASDADIRIIFGHRNNMTENALQLSKEETVPVCTPGYLAKHGPLDDPNRLAEQQLIHLEGDEGSRWFSWQSWLKMLGVERGPAPGDLSLNTYNLVIQAALAEQGIALGWTGLVEDLLKSGALVKAGPMLRRPDHGYWLIASEPDVPVVARLTDWLMEENGGAHR